MGVTYKGNLYPNIKYKPEDIITVNDYNLCCYVLKDYRYQKSSNNVYFELLGASELSIIGGRCDVNIAKYSSFSYFHVVETIVNNFIVRDFSLTPPQDMSSGIYNISFGKEYNLIPLTRASVLKDPFQITDVYATDTVNYSRNGSVIVQASEAPGITGFILTFSSLMLKATMYTFRTYTRRIFN